MRHLQRIHVLLLGALLALSFPLPVAAQPKPEKPPAPPDTLVNWIRSEVAKLRVAEKLISENGNGVANQKEGPAIDAASTSLVDTSSATDFASVALSLTGLEPGDEGEEKPASGSVTASLYSLLAALRGKSLTDPTFYKEKTNWRRVSLTIGSEESKLETHFTDKPATNLGVKWLLINGRDVYSRTAEQEFVGMDQALAGFVVVEQDVRNALDCVIFRAVHPGAGTIADFPNCTQDKEFAEFLKTSPFDATNWPETRKKLEKNADAMKEARALIARQAAGQQITGEAISGAVDRIRRARQLAIAYYTKQREDDGTDEHRAELIFDYGFTERLNWTVNASFDFSDRKQSEDTRAGRVATEFQAKFGGAGVRAWSARPVVLSGSGEASKDPDSDWLVRAQVKIVVPVTTGVDVPIAYTYANRDTDEFESGSRLRFSLAIDPVRLRERFR